MQPEAKMMQTEALEIPANAAMLTIAQVAELLHVHPNSVRRWTNEGLLHCYRVGIRGDRRFSADDIAEFIESGGGKPNGHKPNGHKPNGI